MHTPCCWSLQAHWVELRAADGSVVVSYNKQTAEVRWVWPTDNKVMCKTRRERIKTFSYM